MALTTLTRRYVHGIGNDDPMVMYVGTGTSDKRYLMADERGSIIIETNSSGATSITHKYGPFGEPMDTSTSRFRYTGQILLPGTELYYYKARIYHPKLGRFLQTDPIGYDDHMNLYAYVDNDPINYLDPTGLCRSNNGNPASDCPSRETFPESGTEANIVEVNLAAGPAVSVEVGVVKDSEGNKGIQLSVQVGGGTPEASIEAGKEYTTADNITALAGDSGATTIGGGEGVVGSVGGIAGDGYVGHSETVGFGTGTPVGKSGGVEQTWIFPIGKKKKGK